MSTPERQTLAARMMQARHRTAAALARPAPTRKPGTGWQLAARPDEALFLMPGQLHFGDQAASLQTLLGSCVALTLWHPVRRLGGMCHFLLPSRTRGAGEPLDGRYGDEAMETLLQHIHRHQTTPQEYHAHLYGGADTLPEGSNLKFNVGERNIEAGWLFVDRWGLQLQGVDVGEDMPRSVRLQLATGEVEMRRGKGRPAPVQPPTFLQPSAPVAAATKRHESP